jgi:hypothetical protein
MSSNPIQRAYELARSGRFAYIAQIKAQLKREHYDGVEAHLSGRGFQLELRREMAAARKCSLEKDLRKELHADRVSDVAQLRQ